MIEFGFKNFRKFQDLTPLELGGVTIFVGENNAGKSSFSKGLMLMLHNLREMRPLGFLNRDFILKPIQFIISRVLSQGSLTKITKAI